MTGKMGGREEQSPYHAITPSPCLKRLNELGIRFHEMGGWVVELTRLRSYPALGDLSRKPFCGHLFHPSELDSNQRKKNPSSSDFSLCRPIHSPLWPQILDSTSETAFVSGGGLKALQGAGKNLRPELSQRSFCFFIYDGGPPFELVPPIPDYFLRLRCIHRMDPDLSGRSLSDGRHRRSPAGIWTDEVISQIFSPPCSPRLQFVCFFMLIVFLF